MCTIQKLCETVTNPITLKILGFILQDSLYKDKINRQYTLTLGQSFNNVTNSFKIKD